VKRDQVGGFELLERLGTGGRGEVFLARPTGGSELVALRRIHSSLLADPAQRARVLEAARTEVGLRHPGIVAVMAPVLLDDDVLVPMQYVPGVDLRDLLAPARTRPAPPGVVARIGVAVGEALEAAAASPVPVLHGDLRPAAVRLGLDGAVRVRDFAGLHPAAGYMRSGSPLLGRFRYWAPEWIEAGLDQPRDLAGQVFAIGGMLWELSTGARLFGGQGDLAQLQEILTGPILAPSSRAPDVAPALDAVVLRALARDRGARYPAPAALAEALRTAAATHGWDTSAAALVAWIAGARGMPRWGPP
jgi:serine/threonine protein kinase